MELNLKKIGLLANWINAKIYFCEPYASYQRGTNENSNGMIRRFYKKKTNFSEISDSEIMEVQHLINNMRREK